MVAPVIRRIRDERSLLAEIEDMYERVRNRAFELFRSDGTRNSVDNWLQAERETFSKPAIDFVDKDNSYVLQAGVPGMEPPDLDVQISKGRLVIKAAKTHEHRDEHEKVLRCEYSCGKLFREITLPDDADADSVSAKLEKGLLTITFGKLTPAKTKDPVTKVPVTAAS
jgi:HSP20 family protein